MPLASLLKKFRGQVHSKGIDLDPTKARAIQL